MPRKAVAFENIPKLYGDSAERYKVMGSNLGSSIGTVAALAEIIDTQATYEGDKGQDLTALQMCVEQLARLQEESAARGRICLNLRTSLVREINNDEAAINDTEEYKRQVEVTSQRWKPGTESDGILSRKTDVRNLRVMVRRVTSGDDDDEVQVQMTTDGAVGTCPVTQGPLEDPLVNRECGHVYSTVGIIGALCQGNIRGLAPKKLEDVNPTFTKNCPRAGCTGKVNASMLERDFRTENTLRFAQRRAATQQEDPDDDVEVL